MIKYTAYLEKYQKPMYDLFVQLTKEEVFFKELSFTEFQNKLFNNPYFQSKGTFVALDDDKLVGFASGNIVDDNPKTSGYLNTIIVQKDYRRQGIGSKLLDLVEEYLKAQGKSSARFVFLSQINWPWYIPYTSKHEHPGMPAVRINSDFYLFLYHHHYFVNSIHEGFHLPLANYELPQAVVDKMAENAKKGLTVEVYDAKKHTGIEEFCREIDNPGFAGAIMNNLKKPHPMPFLVALDNNKVVGWTGAMYKEETGRGHLDGICVAPNSRNLGLGKALFCYLCAYLKEHGASYMTFFTGLDNKARYIYLFAGFKIAQSFADMKKNFE